MTMLLNFVEPMQLGNVCTGRGLPLTNNPGLRSLRCDIKTNGITMGPITSAVLLYGVERLLTRILAGQIHRKGVIRKIRRLSSMIVEFHTMCDIIMDVVEDMLTQ